MSVAARQIRLSRWAQAHGITARAARQLIDCGTLPAELGPVQIGKFWYVRVLDDTCLTCVAYARVSSHDERSDLERQMPRLLEHAQRHRIEVDRVIAEVGSGLDATRPKLPKAPGSMRRSAPSRTPRSPRRAR